MQIQIGIILYMDNIFKVKFRKKILSMQDISLNKKKILIFPECYECQQAVKKLAFLCKKKDINFVYLFKPQKCQDFSKYYDLYNMTTIIVVVKDFNYKKDKADIEEKEKNEKNIEKNNEKNEKKKDKDKDIFVRIIKDDNNIKELYTNINELVEKYAIT